MAKIVVLGAGICDHTVTALSLSLTQKHAASTSNRLAIANENCYTHKILGGQGCSM